jgi:PAS domain S-box-containing protein
MRSQHVPDDAYRDLPSEERFRLIVDSIPGFVCTLNASGGVELLNRQLLEYFGKTIPELKNWQMSDAVHAEDLPRAIAAWRHALETGQPYDLELRQRRADGVYRWFQARALPARDAKGRTTGWYMLLTDIDDRKRMEHELATTIETIPALVLSFLPDGTVDFVSHRWLDYVGLSREEMFPTRQPLSPALGGAWKSTNHPDDLDRALNKWQTALATGEPLELETRYRRADGQYRWFLVRSVPLRDEIEKIVKWYATFTDIDDRKRVEEALRSSERDLRLMVDSIPGFVSTANAAGEVEHVNRRVLEYFGKTLEEMKQWATNDVVHPDDMPRLTDAYRHSMQTGQPLDVEHRSRRADGVYRWCHLRGVPQRDPDGKIVRWYSLVTDIDERKQAEEHARRSEAFLTEAQHLSRTGSFGCNVASGEMHWSEQTFRILAYDRSTTPALDAIVQRAHPDDRAALTDAIDRATRDGKDCDLAFRLSLPDGSIRRVHVVAHAGVDGSGGLQFVGAIMDVTEQWQARVELERAFGEKTKSEAELRTVIDVIPQLIVTIGPDGKLEHANQALLEYTGLSEEELHSARIGEVFLQEDTERLKDQREAALARRAPFEYERRVRRKDGQYRWLLIQYNPLLDERGEVIRWYATGTDIDDRKHAEERTRQENVALREQIDQAFMFEEIVGSSAALKTVLSSLVQVAPTDSTVLITGETGTGKELIARAIHKRSQRAGQAFISVNCAAIPTSLIASELFGHEKGAFTGAMQRREGRFELAHGGTIFLDEIGELPAETQLALLRVIQERRFERVGGNRAIPVDVRIIAATNRELAAAIASGTFRADLFYRLNVFPIEMPSLRQRKEDIPMLLEYFVKRYAAKVRKHIRKIDKATLDLFVSYHWPGNIRELQNIVERAVILCNGDTFSVDPAWLSSGAGRPEVDGLANALESYEKEIIERALTESNGKVAGPGGAAAKLGMPRTTLDARIKQLNIKRQTIR